MNLKKTRKQIMSAFLSFAIVLSLLPTAMAANASTLATFALSDITATGATLTVTRLVESCASIDDVANALNGGYLIRTAAEDTVQLDSYGSVMAESGAVSLTADENTYYEFFMGFDTDILIDSDGATMTSKLSTTISVADLEPDTEYVLYSAAMKINSAESQEYQRITFTTPAAVEEPKLATFALSDITATGATLTVTRLVESCASIDDVANALNGGYLIRTAAEDTVQLDSYGSVMAESGAVSLTADENTYYEFFMGFDTDILIDSDGATMTSKLSTTISVADLEPDTEYVLYSAAMKINSAESQEYQRITFTTPAAVEEPEILRSLTIANTIENGTVSTNDGKASYAKNTEVTLSVEPSGGYSLSRLYYVTSQNEAQVEIDKATKSFFMPDSNITVYAEFSIAVEIMELSYKASPTADEATTKTYSTYGEAIAELNGLGADCTQVTLKLLANVATERIPLNQTGTAITIGRSCTLDLNGFTLSGRPVSSESTLIGVASATDAPISFVLTSSKDGGEIVVEGNAWGKAVKIGADFDINHLEIALPKVTFSMNNVILRANLIALHTDKYVDVTIEDSEIYGTYRDSSDGRGAITRTKIESGDSCYNALVTSSAIITDSTITNTGATDSGDTYVSGALFINFNLSARWAGFGVDSGIPAVVISGSAITAKDIDAIAVKFVANTQSVGNKGDIEIEIADTRISSETGAGVYVHNGGNANSGTLQLTLGDGVAVSGKTYAVATSSIHSLEMELSSNTYWKYSDGSIPFYPNSGMLTFPAGMQINPVAETTGHYAGYHTFKAAGTNDQDFTTWNELFSQAEAIYTEGNDDYTYNSTRWDEFVAEYGVAQAFNAAQHTNMNQAEIDYFVGNLKVVVDALSAPVETLTTGNYKADATMYFNNQIAYGTLSMSDAAFAKEVEISVRGENATITFYAISPLPAWTQYDPTITNFKAMIKGTEYESVQGSTKVTKTAKADSTLFGVVQGTDYPCYPYTMTIPTSALTSGYINLSIYAYPMQGFEQQDIDMVIENFVTQDVTEPTLYVNKTESSLIAPAHDADPVADTASAVLVGPTGYELKVASDDLAVATAEIDTTTGIVTITPVGEGAATITVTASNGTEGKDLTQTISIHVAASTAKAVVVENTKVSGSSATATITGNTLATVGSGRVTVGGTVTIDAATTMVGAATSSAVTIESEAAAALANSDKAVTIKTNMGNVTLDTSLMDKIAVETGDVVLEVKTATLPAETSGRFEKTYELTLTSDGSAVNFGSGSATVTVPTTLTSGYAYCIDADGNKTERQPLTIVGNNASWRMNHFSTWALSSTEYELNNGTNPGGGTTPGGQTGFFLTDGNYYVDIDLYKESETAESMGNVAFQNNSRALITVSNGEITTVQVGTNPVDVSGYHSAIIRFSVTGSSVSVLDKGNVTTSSPTVSAIQEYDYVKLAQFNMPDGGQPSSSDEITYVPVVFYVPDTPMDSVVNAASGLNARIRFTWSSASSTSDTRLSVNDGAASGNSSITGTTIKDLDLTDKNTGIRLNATTEELDDKATLTVTALTSGSDYTNAQQAMRSETESWSLYRVVAMVDGQEIAPNGSVNLYIPCTSAGLTVYRINAGGTRVVLRGSVEDGYYKLSTSSLGLFAIVGELGANQFVEDIKDSTTGIRLTSANDVLPDGATLNVTAVTSGSIFTTAQTALADSTTKFSVYTIAAQTSAGRVATPSGAFNLLFPVPSGYTASRTAVYRVANGQLTEVTSTLSSDSKTRTISATELGTFVVAERNANALDNFTDLIDHWAREYIEVVVERGLFAGTSETTFSPNSSMTRGMFVTVLGRLAGIDADAAAYQTNRFTDVGADAYYAAYIAWASQNNIVNGTGDTTFAPDRAISRQEMAVIISHYVEFAKITLKDDSAFQFTDADQIGSWALADVEKIVKAGLLVGTGNGEFSPADTATRAQVATLLARFITNYSL